MGGRGILRRPAGVLALVAVAAAVASTGASAARPPGAPPFMASQASSAPSPAASTLPANFQESVVFSGLTNPTAVRFSPDGRVFVAEKSGKIWVYPSLGATTRTLFADLSGEVDNYWDRGLLGLALDPNFPTTPYVYVLYTYDAPIGGTAPVWNDACPSPPGATTDGCVVSGRLSRLTASGNTMTGAEQVLIEGWCQQFPSHSIGDLRFGADGALYVSGGDGANFNAVDYGQYGGSAGSPTAANPCGDPPSQAGTADSPPSAQGGALRSQSLGRPSGPALLNGDILRVDPSTGAAASGNPLASSSDLNARRIVAEGLRNPFRFTFKPGTNDLWVGDVGWNTWEEINHDASPTAGVLNFGWPCYEGGASGSTYTSLIQSGYQSANLTICNNLYNSPGSVTAPYYSYNHADSVVSGDGCPTGGSSITGLAFYNGGSYPSSYNGALFFADHTRNCIWVMFPGNNGLPNPANRAVFIAGAAGPVDLEIGPGGDLYYVDFDGGTIRRVQYLGANNNAPTAVATASPTSGSAPLTVNFDGSGSSDPDPGDTITYSWDLNGDGVFGDATTAKTSFTYTQPGTYNAQLRVTDSHGASSTTQPITINVNTAAPTAVIDTPSPSLTWIVGQTIGYSGHATDSSGTALPASALTWAIILHHCFTPDNCHTHTVQTVSGVSSGSFQAPDHAYPSYLEIQLTATDSGGLSSTTSVRLDPKTVVLSFNSNPSGLQLAVNGASATTPFTTTVIVNSANSVSATTPQTNGTGTYVFDSWSDGGAQSHTVTAPATAATYTASYHLDHAPTAVISANPAGGGTVPLTEQFSAAGSNDPDAGDTLSYSWDLNGDGVFGDSTAVAPTYTYTKPGQLRVSLRVTDQVGAAATTTTTLKFRKK